MLSVAAFGPPVKGVVQRANPSLALQGALRSGRNAVLSGINALSVRPGTQTAITLMDNQASPAQVTSVRHAGAFADGSVAIGYSAITHTAYLYRLDAGLTGYYNTSGTFTSSSTAAPIAVIWSNMTSVPDVLVTEGLGTLYIANTVASDSNGLYWPTMTYTDFSSSVTTLKASGTDGSSAGTDVAYFNGVIGFAQALFGWGYGAGASPATAFRPEMLRFSPPSFGNLQTNDSLTVGDRVRSQRERIIGAGIAGNALYVGASGVLSRIIGYGAQTFSRDNVDKSYGFVGPKCMVSAGESLYYWSRRGPFRIDAGGSPLALYDAIPDTVASIAQPSSIVASFDPDRDQVIFTYDSGSGVRNWCAFDVRRDVWLGPDNDWGVSIACAGVVEPYASSTASPPSGPAAAPTSASTTSIGQSSAVANWTPGDLSSQTEVSYRLQGASSFTVIPSLVSAGVSSYTFSTLSAGSAYEWRVRHVLNNQYTIYLGPTSATQFTTAASASSTLLPPTNLAADGLNPKQQARVSWTNSGETGVKTEIWRGDLNTDGNYAPIQTVGTGLSSATVSVSSYGTWYFEVRHVKNDGSVSALTPSVSCTVSALV